MFKTVFGDLCSVDFLEEKFDDKWTEFKKLMYNKADTSIAVNSPVASSSIMWQCFGTYSSKSLEEQNLIRKGRDLSICRIYLNLVYRVKGRRVTCRNFSSILSFYHLNFLFFSTRLSKLYRMAFLIGVGKFFKNNFE